MMNQENCKYTTASRCENNTLILKFNKVFNMNV